MSNPPEKTLFVFDNDGYVVPPDSMMGFKEKNWMALVTGRDKKYKWARKFIPQHIPLPNSVPKYHQSSFKMGQIYQFHASFQERSAEEITEKKRQVPKESHWLIDRRARLESKYNGFWQVTGIDTTGIHVARITEADLKKRFPLELFGTDDSQTSLFDYMGNE